MGDGELLLIVLFLLYSSDCLVWIRNQSFAFVSPWHRRWRVTVGNYLLGNERGSLLFLNPLPPLGRLFFAHLSPVSISPLGVCAFNPQTLFRYRRATQSGRAVRFSEISSASHDGAQLLINGEKFAKCAHAGQASRISDLITAMVAAAAAERDHLLRAYLAGQFSLKDATARRQEGEHLIKPILGSCWFFFGFLFVVTPVLVNIFGLLRLIIPLGVMIVFLAVQISVMFFRVHKKLFRRETSERVESLIKMVLCPPVAIRATDLLTRNLLSDYSPIVLASLFQPAASRNFVRSFILDLQHPLAYDVNDEASEEIIQWALVAQLSLCLDYVERAKLSKGESLLAPPQPDEDSITYCPRCRAQFILQSGQCSDCPGVVLLTFSGAGESEKGSVV
jgi:hypothetical protein